VPADGLARRAQHEAGRALVAHLLEHHPPVHKVTILAHGLTAGHMHCVELDDRTVRTRAELQAQLTATLAGPVAEQLVFADIASGSEGDIETATRLAEAMVRRYGMSRLGPVSLPSTSSACSQSTTQIVDAEIRDLIEQARAEATAILTSNRSTLDKLAMALIEAETLEGEALARALAEPAG
jgi:cell division protease FtsH